MTDLSLVELVLQPLDSQSSETLINNMLNIKGLHHGVKAQIIERAGGNPFFIEEVVRALIDEGAVVVKDGGFEVTDKINSVVIPPTINDVLMARIDRLDEESRNVVKVASVIGRSFFYRILADVISRVEGLDDKLEYLKQIQLIRERIQMNELEYLFKHALAQEAAYESTLLQQRKQLHLKVAESIERLFSERLHEFYGILAMHYSRADNLEKAEEYIVQSRRGGHCGHLPPARPSPIFCRPCNFTPGNMAKRQIRKSWRDLKKTSRWLTTAEGNSGKPFSTSTKSL